jgi:hypothetical protein
MANEIGDFAKLREPFPKEQIQKLDAGYAKLDYVSHAWVTDRLLKVDPTWSWEPVAFDDQGLPLFDENGGLWIRLTVLGVTRYGYGEPQGRDRFDSKKGAIGNALRNAAMRFGVALDLWAKESGENAPKARTAPTKGIPEDSDPWGENAPRVAGDRPGTSFTAELMTEPQRKAIFAICVGSADKVVANFKAANGIDPGTKLSKRDASKLIETIKANGYAEFLGDSQ